MPRRYMGEWSYRSTFVTSAKRRAEGLVRFYTMAALERDASRRLGGPQRWSGHSGKKKNLSPCQESNPHHFGCRESLRRLSYPVAKCIYTHGSGASSVVLLDFVCPW
jgi:hypothetical protein